MLLTRTPRATIFNADQIDLYAFRVVGHIGYQCEALDTGNSENAFFAVWHAQIASYHAMYMNLPGWVQSTEGYKVARNTVDTGTTKSIILRSLATLGQVQRSTELPRWTTMGGEFTTQHVVTLSFRIPDLSTSKMVQWDCHIDNKVQCEHSPYDLILGLDLINELP